MAITIVKKGDPKKRDPKAPKALVLAGGALTGASFKAGGLKAFNDYLTGFQITDFDIFLGISSGSLLAAALCGGLTPEEMLMVFEGKSKRFPKMEPWHFYLPNWQEWFTRPVKFSWKTLKTLASKALWADGPPMPSWIELIPSGIFNNAPLENYLRTNIKKNRMTNSFKATYKWRKKRLYIVAMTLDGAREIVFGPDEISHIPISKAVQASTAVPGFYKPVKIGNDYYVDGAVRRTANIDLIVEKGAQLIVCYNPFRPYENHAFSEGKSLIEEGVFAVLNQVFRTFFHTRLHGALKMYQESPHFQGDIILIEPSAQDRAFFSLNPFSLGHQLEAARLGFESVRNSIEEKFDEIAEVLAAYGIEMSQKNVEEEYRQLHRRKTPKKKVQQILEG